MLGWRGFRELVLVKIIRGFETPKLQNVDLTVHCFLNFGNSDHFLPLFQGDSKFY